MNKIVTAFIRYSNDNCKYYQKLIDISKKKKIDLLNFFNNYQGIEGFTDIKNLSKSQLFIIDFEKEQKSNTIGFDVGIFDNDYCSFSSIFHEIIFSKSDSFPDYFKLLNTRFLFRSYQNAYDYLIKHKALRDKGVDLEWEDKMLIYRISYYDETIM